MKKQEFLKLLVRYIDYLSAAHTASFEWNHLSGSKTAQLSTVLILLQQTPFIPNALQRKSCWVLKRKLYHSPMYQHHSRLQTHHQAHDPGTKHLPLQLDPGLPDGPHPSGECRQQHIRHADHQHGGPSGGCALSPPVHPAWTCMTLTSSSSLLTTQQ